MAMILLYCTVKYSPVLGVVDEKKESKGGWGEDEASAQENSSWFMVVQYCHK